VIPTLRRDLVPQIDTSIPAVVLKLDHNVMHHGGLGVIRTLGRLGIRVYGVHEGRWAPAANSRYLYGRFIWEPGSASPDQLVSGLQRLAERIGRPAVLIATDDAGAIFLAEQGDDLRPQFLFPRPPAHLPRQLAGKHSMSEVCRDLGVPCPLAVVPDSLTTALGFAASSGFPLIGKLTAPWHARKNLRSTTIVHDQRELTDLYKACRQATADLMLQEFIPGGSGYDWFFHGYCSEDSTCRPAFTGVKERSYPAHAGLTSLGRAVPNARLRNEVVELLGTISYRGIVDIDIRWDARDDQYKLLDVNPRLGAQFRLFEDSAGTDVVIAQYLDLTGQPVPEGDQINERSYLVENYDPIAAMSYWRDGELQLRSWIASLRTVNEVAWFARDDLQPFGLMCLRMAWRLASRPLVGQYSQPTHAKEPRYQRGRGAARPVACLPTNETRCATHAAEHRPGEEDIRV
jgi:D-aspartate ligase